MVYALLADGFEEMEAVCAIDVLRRAGLEVCLTGVTGRLTTSSHDVRIDTDMVISDTELNEGDVLFLPGGTAGVENIGKSDKARLLITGAYKAGCVIGAICAAPGLLADMGLLKGLNVTSHPTVREKIEQGEAQWLNVPWARAGQFVTGRGPGASLPFALGFAAALIGKETADKLAAQMIIDY